ncbi:hypothetical protein G7Y89_g14766 [Cudoniella acicularis]|uniref:HAD-like protein n=1 Tax=Cudoniella acicularis TaxID=354080 RepID=A0A8H4QXN9_9HELO|nr:hypothetical protein G7Y89_g14766 [Cudoniella acicularis]
MNLSNYSHLIVDLGNVLFTWSPETKTSISRSTFHSILNTQTWNEYECGHLSETQCYAEIAETFSLDTTEIQQAFKDTRNSLQPNSELFTELKALKSAAGRKLQLVAFSNISAPDWDSLSNKSTDWDVFDNIITSHSIRQRKPNIKVYIKMFEQAGIEAAGSAIFVDDKLENVISARSLGVTGIVFDNTENVIRRLRNLLGNPLERANEFLKKNVGNLESMTDGGVIIQDNFSQLMILDITGDPSLVHLEAPSPGKELQTWNYFRGNPILTTDTFPDDFDTTSLALLTTAVSDNAANNIMNEMLKYKSVDGITQSYFDHSRPRVDSVICCNVLRLFYRYHRGHEVQETFQWVESVLIQRAYLEGTKYYTAAESFLYWLAKFVEENASVSGIEDRFREPLKARLSERVNMPGNTMSVSLRARACQMMKIDASADVKQLLEMQESDESWRAGWWCKFGSKSIDIENPGLVTALAVKVITIHFEGTSRREAATPEFDKQRWILKYRWGGLRKLFRLMWLCNGATTEVLILPYAPGPRRTWRSLSTCPQFAILKKLHADNSTAPIIGYPGDSLVTNFELDVESGNWTDTWRFMPNNTGLNPQRYSNGGVVDLGFPDQENLWMASFGIILEQNGTWDFGPQTWTDITITANSTDATWCTSPQIGSDTFNYTMSEPQGNVTANGTSTCYIAKLTFQYPEPSTDDADSSDDSPDNSNDTDSSDDSSDADSSDYVDSSDDYAY